MIDWVLGLPWGWAVAVLWVIVMGRANGSYWIGRGIAAGASRSRWARLLESRTYTSSAAVAERWGPLAVTLSFLTVGAQTCVQVWAGATRMPLRLYLPAVALGAVLWSVLYATVGLAVVRLWAERGGLWVLGLAALTGLAVWTCRRLQAQREPGVQAQREPGVQAPDSAA